MPQYVYPFVEATDYHQLHWDGSNAVDVFGPSHSRIVAVTDGVAQVQNFPLGGHTVMLNGDDGRVYYHAHLVQGSGVGGRVAVGQQIGLMDNTGNAFDRPTHCHWAVGTAAFGINDDGAGDIPAWLVLNDLPHGAPTRPTMAQLAVANPNIISQRATWAALREANGDDPNDWAAFRRFQMDIFAPDPGPVEPSDFRTNVVPGLKMAQLAVANPNIHSQRATWAMLRRANGDDPNDWPAFRQFQIDIGAPDPGPNVPVDFPV